MDRYELFYHPIPFRGHFIRYVLAQAGQGWIEPSHDEVIALADRVPGMRGVYAGRLRNAAQVESLTANLISINRRYKVHAGIRVTDLP